MLNGLFRKARADVAGRPLQTGLVFVVVAIATGILAVAVTAQVTADRTFMTRFEEGNGAHVWFYYTRHRVGEGGPSELMRIGELEEVTATSGPIPYASRFPVMLDEGSVDLRLYGLPPVLPEVGRPIVTRGEWLSPDGDREIVLDHGLARVRDIEIGDQLEVLGRDGSETFEVVGLFVSAGLSYPHTYSESTPYASAYVLPAGLETMEPDRDKWAWTYGVRVRDPEAADQLARTTWQMYPDGQSPSLATWKASRAQVSEGLMLYTVFIGLFGIFAVGVAAFVIVNVVAGNVLVQLRDIGLLKSVGFTPRQVTTLLLAEHAGVGLLAAVAGVAIGYAAAPFVLRVTGDILGMPASPAFDAPLMAAIVLGVTLAITATALAPAWQGGKVSTVQALTSGLSRPQSSASRAVGLAALLRLPMVVVVGLKDVFTRPVVRSVLTITALLVAVVLATFGLGMEATLRDVIEDPRLTGGAPYEVSAVLRPGADEMSPLEVGALLDSLPEIDSYFGGLRLVGDLETGAQGEGRLNKVFIGAPDEGYTALAPYVPEGRLFTEPGEAIITKRTAEERGLGVRDGFTFVIDGELSNNRDMDGGKLDLRVAGIYVDDALEVMTSLDTLRQQLDLDIDPTAYRIKVAAGVDPDALKVALLRKANDRLSVTVLDATEENEKAAGYIRLPLYALTVALLAIGVVSVLITLLFTVRERYREFAILKTLGFTPRQVAASVVSGSFLLAGIALAAGIPLGVAFTRLSLNYIGKESQLGTPFGTMPGPLEITLLVPLILLIAVLGSALPARRAAGITVTEALRFV